MPDDITFQLNFRAIRRPIKKRPLEKGSGTDNSDWPGIAGGLLKKRPTFHRIAPAVMAAANQRPQRQNVKSAPIMQQHNISGGVYEGLCRGYTLSTVRIKTVIGRNPQNTYM